MDLCWKGGWMMNLRLWILWGNCITFRHFVVGNCLFNKKSKLWFSKEINPANLVIINHWAKTYFSIRILIKILSFRKMAKVTPPWKKQNIEIQFQMISCKKWRISVILVWSLPDSSVHGILQARILEWLTFPSPGNLPNPGIEPGSPALRPTLPSERPGRIVKLKLKFSKYYLCRLKNPPKQHWIFSHWHRCIWKKWKIWTRRKHS